MYDFFSLTIYLKCNIQYLKSKNIIAYEVTVRRQPRDFGTYQGKPSRKENVITFPSTENTIVRTIHIVHPYNTKDREK